MKISQRLQRRLFVGISGALLLVAAAGCAPRESTDPLDKQIAGAPADQAPLEAHRITAISDLPVPANMKIKKSRSYSFEGAGTRTVDYTYEGWVDIRRVHRFYLDRMPLNGWQLLTDNYVRGVHTLTHQKDKEICTVIIRKSTIFWTSVRLLIQQPENY